MTRWFAFVDSLDGLLIAVGALLAGTAALLSSVPQLITSFHVRSVQGSSRRRNRLAVITAGTAALVLCAAVMLIVRAATVGAVSAKHGWCARNAENCVLGTGVAVGLVVLRGIVRRRRDQHLLTSPSDVIAIVTSTTGAISGVAVVTKVLCHVFVAPLTPFTIPSLVGGGVVVFVATKALYNLV